MRTPGDDVSRRGRVQLGFLTTEPQKKFASEKRVHHQYDEGAQSQVRHHVDPRGVHQIERMKQLYGDQRCQRQQRRQQQRHFPAPRTKCERVRPRDAPVALHGGDRENHQGKLDAEIEHRKQSQVDGMAPSRWANSGHGRMADADHDVGQSQSEHVQADGRGQFLGIDSYH